MTRAASNTGGNAGNAVGSVEAAAVQSHNHGVNDPGHRHRIGWCSGSPSPGEEVYERQGRDCGGLSPHTLVSTTGISIQNAGGAETRPVNIAANYIIKL